MSDHHYTAAIVGVGKGGKGRAGGNSIGYAHANTYVHHERTDLVAAADINEQNLAHFLDAYDLPESAGYTDHRKMLEAVKPDIVSVCTYVNTHRPIIEDAVAAGVKAVFCEKPFVMNMDDARAVAETCEKAGVKLIANHYRRDLDVFQTAARLVREGAIGQPVLFYAGINDWDQMEWGAHWLDAFCAIAGDQPVKTVSATVRCTGEKETRFGHHMEDYSLACYTFADGTRAILEGGKKPNGDFAMRLVGNDGLIDVKGNQEVRLLNADGERTLTCQSTAHMNRDDRQPRDADGNPIMAYPFLIDDLVAWMEGGSEPSTGPTNVLRTTEMYLAAYESGLRGDVIELPLGPQSEFPLDAIVRRQKSE